MVQFIWLWCCSLALGRQPKVSSQDYNMLFTAYEYLDHENSQTCFLVKLWRLHYTKCDLHIMIDENCWELLIPSFQLWIHNHNKEALLSLATAQSTFIKSLLANIVFRVASILQNKKSLLIFTQWLEKIENLNSNIFQSLQDANARLPDWLIIRNLFLLISVTRHWWSSHYRNSWGDIQCLRNWRSNAAELTLKHWLKGIREAV